MVMMEKKTEYEIKFGFCDKCHSERYFYQHISGGLWFCQLCGYNNEGDEKNESFSLENNQREE